MPDDTLRDRSDLYREGIRLFNARDYYEAHEVWEDLWKQVGGSAADFYKGLIQMAVATLHWERGNVAGARKLYRTARGYLSSYVPTFQGLDVVGFLQMMEDYFDPLLAAVKRQEAAPPPETDRPPRIVLGRPIEGTGRP